MRAREILREEAAAQSSYPPRRRQSLCRCDPRYRWKSAMVLVLSMLLLPYLVCTCGDAGRRELGHTVTSTSTGGRSSGSWQRAREG